jgi:hypothetical protein
MDAVHKSVAVCAAPAVVPHTIEGVWQRQTASRYRRACRLRLQRCTAPSCDAEGGIRQAELAPKGQAESAPTGQAGEVLVALCMDSRCVRDRLATSLQKSRARTPAALLALVRSRGDYGRIYSCTLLRMRTAQCARSCLWVGSRNVALGSTTLLIVDKRIVDKQRGAVQTGDESVASACVRRPEPLRTHVCSPTGLLRRQRSFVQSAMAGQHQGTHRGLRCYHAWSLLTCSS